MSESGDTRVIHRYMKHLGPQNFQISTLAVVKSLEEARAKWLQYRGTFMSHQDGLNASDDLEVFEGYRHTHGPVSRAKIAVARKGTKQTERSKALIAQSRRGKSLGDQNSMNDPKARAKVGASKVGRKKVWLADGTYKYVFPEKCAETALLFNVLQGGNGP